MTTTFSFGQKFSVGSEVGFISVININYKPTNINNRRNTYYSGINFNYKYNSRVSFSSGLHYLRQGYRHSTCAPFKDISDNELVSKIDYLTIPITANIHFLKSRKLIATLGLLNGYNIKAAQDMTQPVSGCEIGYATDLTYEIKKYSISGTIGIGYKVFENKKFELVPTLKYYQGLTNNFKNLYVGILHVEQYSSALMTISFNYKL